MDRQKSRAVGQVGGIRARIVACSSATALLASVGLAASPPVAAQTAEPIGYVLKLEGQWTVGGSRPLKLGQALTRDDVAAGLAGSGPADRLSLVLGGTPHTCVQRCEKSMGAAPADAKSGAFADSMLKSAMKIFQQKPDFPATVTIRGRLGDGVAATEAGRVDLSSVLKECRSDRIDLRFQTVAETPVRTIEPVAVPCEQGRPAPTLARGVEPGLYRIDLLQRSSDGYVARGVSAWVLVSPKDRYPQDQAAFAEAVKVSRSWEPAIEPETVLALQRAYLEHLANELRARP
jgi:hypothetical protein